MLVHECVRAALHAPTLFFVSCSQQKCDWKYLRDKWRTNHTPVTETRRYIGVEAACRAGAGSASAQAQPPSRSLTCFPRINHFWRDVGVLLSSLRWQTLSLSLFLCKFLLSLWRCFGLLAWRTTNSIFEWRGVQRAQLGPCLLFTS